VSGLPLPVTSRHSWELSIDPGARAGTTAWDRVRGDAPLRHTVRGVLVELEDAMLPYDLHRGPRCDTINPAMARTTDNAARNSSGRTRGSARGSPPAGTSPSKPVKVYFIHPNAHSDYARELADHLEKMPGASFEVLDYKLKPPEPSWTAKIRRWLGEADLFLLLWSAHAEKSNPVMSELDNASSLMQNEKRTIAVLVLDECPVPTDLGGCERREASQCDVKEIAHWIAGLAGFSPQQPPLRVRLLGCESLVERLLRRLREESGVFLLYGEPGVGKTAIADHVARQFSDWNLKVVRFSGEQLSWGMGEFPEDTRLVILDDVCDEHLKRLPPGLKASVLCTAISQVRGRVPTDNVFKVESLAPEDARTLLLRKVSDSLKAACLAHFHEVAMRVECSPAAIIEAAAGLSPAARPVESVASLLEHGVPNQVKRWAEVAGSVKEDGRRLLMAFAVSCPRGSWGEFAGQVAGLDDNQVRVQLGRLVQLSLLQDVDISRERFRVHRLLRDALQQQAAAWRKAGERHALQLDGFLASGGQRERKCLEEVVPASERLRNENRLDQADKLLRQGRSAILSPIGEESRVLTALEASLQARGATAKPHAAEILRQYYLNRAKLYRLSDRRKDYLDARKSLEVHLRLCHRAGDWAAEADALGLLAATRCSLARTPTPGGSRTPEVPEDVDQILRLLRRQESLCRRKGDAVRAAGAVLARFSFLQELKRMEDAASAWRSLQRSEPAMSMAGDESSPVFLVDLLADLWQIRQNERVRSGNVNSKVQGASAGAGVNKADAIREYVRFAAASADPEMPSSSPAESLVSGFSVLFLENYRWALRPDPAVEGDDPPPEPDERVPDAAGPAIADGLITENPDVALDRLESRKERFLRDGNLRGVRNCELHLARIERIRGRSECAYEILAARARVCRRVGDKRGWVECLGPQIEILRGWNKKKEADDLCRFRDVLRREVWLQEALGFAYWNWGLLAVAQARPDRPGARACLSDAAAIFGSLQMWEEQRGVATNIARFLDAAG